ncbi:phosphoesterase [Echria macrotheca]|uniref:Phosphoesterase n=1 Tax=Echria macrotheca TaxID=438768 RepID=A0AAJ0B112_9PEZI|nr:phosphoesterase [Echria macrotheca]
MPSPIRIIAAMVVAASPAMAGNLQTNIKNVVILVMENRSLDNLLGGQTTAGIENPINNGPYCNYYNISNPSAGQACSAASDYNSVANDPDHAVYGNNFEFYGTFTPNNAAIAAGTLVATQKGFVQEQIRLYPSVAKATIGKQVMNYYTEAQVPVLTALVKNFVTFNHWHSDIPGPTDPNRAALTSGTSYGHGSNDAAFSSHGLPQRSIFQQLSETSHTWINYYDTAGGTGPDAEFYNWTYTSGNTGRVQSLANFYTAAAAGTLPEFSYLNPSCCGVGTNSMHPSGKISDGEALVKKVYESLRAGPQWNKTLFILTFDESGGFHDHVPPPLAPAPDSLTYTASTPGGSYTFPFNRLGGRIPTLLISPWVAKAHVEQLGTNSAGQTVSYSASSVLRTMGTLWGFSPFNPRVAAAPSFENLIQATLRTDTPVTLPSPASFTRRTAAKEFIA